MRKRIQGLVRELERSKAILCEGDGVLWNGRWAESGMLIGYLRKASDNGGYPSIDGDGKKPVWDENSEVSRLQAVYGIFMRNGWATKHSMEEHSLQYLQEYPIPESVAIIRRAAVPKFLVTQGGSTMANMARRYHYFTGFVSNTDNFDAGGKLLGLEPAICDGEQKAEAAWKRLRRYGISIRDCAVIAGSKFGGIEDITLLLEADKGRRIVPPNAHPKALGLPGIVRLSEFTV